MRRAHCRSSCTELWAGGRPLPTHRPIAVVLLSKLAIVVVVESGVGLDGLLLAQVLVPVSDTVHGSAGDLEVGWGKGRSAQTFAGGGGVAPGSRGRVLKLRSPGAKLDVFAAH